MKAKKLPSGHWRARAYYTVNGEKKCKSFTAETKKEAEYLASVFLMKEKDRKKCGLTVGEAIDEYINSKENILSPTTINSYHGIKKNSLNELCDIPISNLEQGIVQKHFNKLAMKKSPKTLSCAHGLLVSVLNVYAPEIKLNTTLPKKQKKIKNFPKVTQIINVVKGTEIELPCLLAIWQGLRMSEVRGIKKSDIKDGILTINRVIVTVKGQHIIKEETKTIESRRQLRLPEYILNLIDKVDSEYITELSGQAIYKRFSRILKNNDIEHIRFHDLRHLNASVMLSLGVPDKYAMERGGWSSPNIMKSVYQHTFTEERKQVDNKIDDYFKDIIERSDTKADT
ncbi:MAG: site-specific integrase [Ruminococcus sp.]|nr:site-specific integrase [Ruminococcus sp.]